MKNIIKSKNPAQLLRIFTIFSLLSLIVILFLTNFGLHKIFVIQYVNEAEHDAIRISKALFESKRELLTSDFEGEVIMDIDPRDFAELDESMRSYLNPLNIIKIKIFSKDEKIVYSTDRQIIGQIDAHNEKLKRALKGEVVSKLEKKDEVWDLMGEQRYDIDLVETYLPLRDETNKIIGSFEIYLDISRYREGSEKTLKLSMIVITTILVIIFGFLFALMRQETYQLSKNEAALQESEEKLRALSLTDELTGVYNRRGFFSLTEHLLKIAKRQKKGIFMLYADLDNMKEINDTLGHNEGDNALIDIANILKTSYRESDVVARIGGDEFAVIPIETTKKYVDIITARLQKQLDIHNAKSNRSYNLSVSTGIAYYDPENPRSIDELLTEADKLMYEYKRRKQKS